MHALNSLNRGMGLQDAYLCVLSDQALRKLGFVHDTVLAHRRFDVGYSSKKDIDRYGVPQTPLRQLVAFLIGRIRGARV